jgi:murein DD-endopeptidase MepM/ murein hydrolase activator NlpD
MRKRSSVAVAFALGAAAAVALGVFGWRSLPRIWQKLRPETPHQRYARSLVEGGLAHTALATEWLAAATRALQQPVAVTLPFKEDALLDPAQPVSLGYAVTLKRGQKLDVQVTVATDTPGQVFVDLFAPLNKTHADARPVASAQDDGTPLAYEAGESGIYVLRVQPELLRGGHMLVTSAAAPSLRFPVSGAATRAMQSFYGDARDGGRRTHEGVDIFAPRGTPVVAASSGLVMKVGENTLGGQVVWIWDMTRGLRLYYAHLQEQSVRTGAFVRAGDVVGTVGNTGNAKTTPPHLHFGIYARREGAIDPDPFVRPAPRVDENPKLKTSALGDWTRTRAQVALRASPSTSAPILELLPRASAVRVEGALGSWVRIGTHRHSIGFLEARDLEPLRVN